MWRVVAASGSRGQGRVSMSALDPAPHCLWKWRLSLSQQLGYTHSAECRCQPSVSLTCPVRPG